MTTNSVYPNPRARPLGRRVPGRTSSVPGPRGAQKTGGLSPLPAATRYSACPPTLSASLCRFGMLACVHPLSMKKPLRRGACGIIDLHREVAPFSRCPLTSGFQKEPFFYWELLKYLHRIQSASRGTAISIPAVRSSRGIPSCWFVFSGANTLFGRGTPNMLRWIGSLSFKLHLKLGRLTVSICFKPGSTVVRQ